MKIKVLVVHSFAAALSFLLGDDSTGAELLISKHYTSAGQHERVITSYQQMHCSVVSRLMLRETIAAVT
jgi:hypothetical protein